MDNTDWDKEIDKIRAKLRAKPLLLKLDIDPNEPLPKLDLPRFSLTKAFNGTDVGDKTIVFDDREPLFKKDLPKDWDFGPYTIGTGKTAAMQKLILQRPALIADDDAVTAKNPSVADLLELYSRQLAKFIDESKIDSDLWSPPKLQPKLQPVVAQTPAPPPVPAHVVEGLPAVTLSPKDWTNSAHRIEWSTDLPVPIAHYSDVADVAKAIDVELRKHGSSLEAIDRIHIAYPHKNPGLYPTHSNSATHYASSFRDSMMSEESPGKHVIWGMANELVENRKLGRSEDQSSVHALTAQQEYAFYTKGTETSPYALIGGDRKEFFVVVDTGSEQGTTYANLISHIRANGGIVVAVMGAGDNKMLQTASAPEAIEAANLPSKFMDPSRNTKRLPDMAVAFAKSARAEGKDWTPAQCMEMFEEALQKNGNSVFAMTNGEVKRVIKSVTGDYYVPESFPSMLNRLEEKAAAKAAAPAGDKHKHRNM